MWYWALNVLHLTWERNFRNKLIFTCINQFSEKPSTYKNNNKKGETASDIDMRVRANCTQPLQLFGVNTSTCQKHTKTSGQILSCFQLKLTRLNKYRTSMLGIIWSARLLDTHPRDCRKKARFNKTYNSLSTPE